MTVAILFILCIFSSGFTGNIYKKLSHESKNRSMSAFMPSVWFALLGILFGIMAIIEGKMALVQIPIAMAAGICVYTAVVILIESMKTNAMSISIIIVNLNFIITVVLSAVFLKEKAAIIQLIGMIASVAVILILNLKGDVKQGKKGAVLLPLVACIANGLLNFFIKLNGLVWADNGIEGGANTFFAITYLTAACTAIVIGIIFERRESGASVRGILKKETLPFMLLMGVCNGVCFYTTELLAKHMNAAAQFTIVTAASIMISLIVGMLFQKERFTWKVAVSLVFCLIAVLCQMSTLI